MKLRKAYRPKPTKKGQHKHGGQKRIGGNRASRGQPYGKSGKR
jgi:hypothetical protein